MQYKAVARLFWTRGGEGARGALSRVPKTRALWGGVGGGGWCWRIFKFGCSETLFSALFMRCVSEKSTSNKCEKAGVFSAYKCLFPRSC